MAKSSPNKSGSPKKSGSPTKSSKNDDKKTKKSPEKRTLPKWSAEECIKADLETFARKRYEVPMETSYKRVTYHLALIVKKIHIYEVFNEAPEVQQFCNSNKAGKGSPKSKSGSPKSKASKDKKSPKNKKSPVEEEIKIPLYEAPIIEGVIAMRRNVAFQRNEKLFVEITATWKYKEDSKVSPFPPMINADRLCYRDYYHIYPANFERVILPTDYNQTLIRKIRSEYGPEWEGYPFIFDLTGAPSSITFHRPYNHKNHENGIFWVLRCFIGKYEYSRPTSDRDVKMNIWKFTITPSLLTLSLRKSNPFNYIRHKTLDDLGDLVLTASLNRDLYYHGEEISVTITVENNSQRHVVQSITVFFEQNYRFFNEIPHDNSIPLNEIWLKPGENGLPINPKSKNWYKTIQIKPLFDWSKYNLVCDGKMERDEKVFLASSTIIMKDVPLTPEEIEALAVAEGKSPKKKGSPEKGSKSPPKKSSPKKESPKKTSPKKGSPKKESPKRKSPDKNESPTMEKQPSREPSPPPVIPTKRVLVNREKSHCVFISYDIVVRMNLKTLSDKEAGHPAVRVPFILTRETRLINKWTNPPTWNHLPMRCNEIHTSKSQPHVFCKKIENQTEQITKSPKSKKESPKKSKESPKKSKKSPKSKS